MPGIAGIVYSDAKHINHLLNPILDTLTHRGPNHLREEIIHENYQLGICGNTLVRSENLIIGYDGILHNRKALYTSLLQHGKNLYEGNIDDPTLVLYAYETWGESFLEHFEGSYAFFIFDIQNQKLILARDRIGKKPLYWYQDQRHFIFSSELKAILACGAVPQTLATDAIAAYLYLGYIPQDMTPIAGVSKLLPGFSLHLNRDGSKLIYPYWSYSSQFQNKILDDKKSVIQHLNKMIESSVEGLIPNQGSIGCIISGGLGSASTAFYLKEQVKAERLTAYTVAFQKENIDDLEASEDVAQALKIPQIKALIPAENVLDDYVKIAWYLDEPLADPNVIATWQIAELAKSEKVVFSGMGSDELFAGHSRYTIDEQPGANYQKLLYKITNPIVENLLLPLSKVLYRNGAFSLMQKALINPSHLSFLEKNSVFDTELLKEVSPTLSPLFDPNVFLHRFYNLPNIKSDLSSFLYLDVKTRLPDSFIVQYERLMTAHGLDWRAPYLSKKLFEYMAHIPEPHQLTESETYFGLKEILKGILPNTFLNRPKRTRKTDFLNSWVETPALNAAFDMLPKGFLVESGYISQKWLLKQLSSPEKKKESFRLLWAIFALEVWYRIFIHLPITTKPPEISLQNLLAEQ